MLDVGVLVETLETATFWSNRDRLYTAVRDALSEALGEKSLVLCHISPVYETGCLLYFTVAAPQAKDPLAPWYRANQKDSQSMIAAGAPTTHPPPGGTAPHPSGPPH